MRDENEILQIKEGRLREAVREAATIEFLLNDKNECPGVINGVCDDTTRDLSEAVEHMDAKQDANDEEFNQDAPIPDLPTYVSQLKELAVGPILPLLHWAFYTLDEGLVAAVQESVECEWGGLKEISFSEDDLISLICEALHSHCSSNGDAGQVPQHLKTREDGRARSKKEEMSILSGQLREAVEEAATHEHMLEASYLGGSELGGEEDETDPSFLLWLAENEEAGGGVGRHSKCDSSSPSPPIPFPPESPLPCSSLEGYLQKLNSLAEGPVLPLLIWGFHTLPKDLVESVYEGLEIELGNKGFEENFFLQLACINLQNSVLECHQQHQLFCAGGASGTPSGVSLKAGGGGSHAHVLRRGDGRVRGEDECLAVFNGDLRRAAHAAASFEFLLCEAKAAEDEQREPLDLRQSVKGGAWDKGPHHPNHPKVFVPYQPKVFVPQVSVNPGVPNYYNRGGNPLNPRVGVIVSGGGGEKGREGGDVLESSRPSLPPAPSKPLDPEMKSLLTSLECLCGAGINAGKSATHSRHCKDGLYRQLRAYSASFAAQRTELLRKAAEAARSGKKGGGALAGVYAKEARKLAAHTTASNDLASRASLWLFNSGKNYGVPTRSDSRGMRPTHVKLSLSVDGELDLHGQHLSEAATILNDNFFPECTANHWRRVRVITGKGAGGAGKLWVELGAMLRGMAERGDHRVSSCTPEPGSYVITFL